MKAGDTRFNDGNLSRLNSPEFKIGTIDGATAEQIANEDFPQSKRLALPQLSDFAQLLNNIGTGKADVTFTEPADAIGYQNHNPGQIEAAKNAGPVRIFPNCWIIKRGQFKFKEMIDTSLDSLLASGFIKRLIHKYEPAPDTIYQVAPSYKPAPQYN